MKQKKRATAEIKIQAKVWNSVLSSSLIQDQRNYKRDLLEITSMF